MTALVPFNEIRIGHVLFHYGEKSPTVRPRHGIAVRCVSRFALESGGTSLSFLPLRMTILGMLRSIVSSSSLET